MTLLWVRLKSNVHFLKLAYHTTNVNILWLVQCILFSKAASSHLPAQPMSPRPFPHPLFPIYPLPYSMDLITTLAASVS
jgi:hypothetical protein